VRRRPAFPLVLCGIIAALLTVFWASRTPPVSQCVSLQIEGFTNWVGGPRIAVLVITNHSDSDFRLLGWCTITGARPTNSISRERLSENFLTLHGRSSQRFQIGASTNGTAWCGMVRVALDRSYYKTAQSLLNSRVNWIRMLSTTVMPKIRVEDLFSETRYD
jgi:hypothetical protein